MSSVFFYSTVAGRKCEINIIVKLEMTGSYPDSTFVANAVFLFCRARIFSSTVSLHTNLTHTQAALAVPTTVEQQRSPSRLEDTRTLKQNTLAYVCIFQNIEYA